jgi:trk system potassium uptake protein TrkH
VQDVRRMISPESARVVQKWHHITTRVLDDATVRTSMLIVLSYIGIYGLGTGVGVYYGYELVDALFDAVSAGSNTGLSCGVASPTMPALMKIVYIFEMWAGRLEFMSLFALGGYCVAMLRGE